MGGQGGVDALRRGDTGDDVESGQCTGVGADLLVGGDADRDQLEPGILDELDQANRPQFPVPTSATRMAIRFSSRCLVYRSMGGPDGNWNRF